MKAFFSKCDQIRSFMRIWSHLLKKSLMENFIFLCSVMKFLCDNTSWLLIKKKGFSIIDITIAAARDPPK